MKSIKSLADYWRYNKEERAKIYVPEEISVSYPIKESKDKLEYLEVLFKAGGMKIFLEPPSDLKKRVKDIKLRGWAAKKLLQATSKLPNGYYFKVSEGLRPLSYQKQIFEKILIELRRKYPSKNKKELWQEATKYVADPTLCPPHTTGGAIDITIVDAYGKELDMGNPINTVDEKSTTFYKRLSKPVRKNRVLLFNVMTSVGFVNLPPEWWHYSFGDQYWAIFNKKPYALYDKVKY